MDHRNAPKPIANYVICQQYDDTLYFSGAVPSLNGEITVKGKLGKELTVEQGYQAARECGLNLLAALKDAVGDYENVAQVLKLTGFVSCTEDFFQQPAVINGASDVLVEVLGDKGRHARSAVGVIALPNNVPVEVEMIVKRR